jgi:pSer/pThr/pTyr-binding forkhead associated (FHA) protein
VKDNSKNKTYLNGVEVAGETALRDEDVLQLGKATVKIKILSY